MPARPAAVAFDVLQTTVSLAPLRGPLTDLGLPDHALEVWFARTLRDGFALAAAGVFRPFREVADGTLTGLLVEHGRPAGRDDVAGVLDRMAELPAHPDAGPAVGRLRVAGVRVLALTNGSEANTHALLKRAGLLGAVERVVSIDEVGQWKPRAEVYQYAATVAGVEPGRLALVAAHAWDCHGAHRAGLTAGWVRRAEPVYNPAFGRPDAEGDNLPAVCEALLRLPG
jgi:2-haloacid dehalogenase